MMNGSGNRRKDRWDSRISKQQQLILNSEEQLESKLGFELFTEGDKRLGWLLTFASVSILKISPICPRFHPIYMHLIISDFIFPNLMCFLNIVVLGGPGN